MPPHLVLICYRIAMSHERQFILELARDDDPTNAIVAMISQIRDFATTANLAAHLSNRLCVVVEELVSNIVRHGHYGNAVRVELALKCADSALEVSIEDNTAPFDPTEARDFAGPDPLTGGGVGLELVRRLASEHTYFRENGKNNAKLVLK